ncbi:glycosyltransferase family 2 protein [Novosphingobium sp. MD-1]|uniref:glycosyltransferase family 2 protein n=1 Tax=Novosphingobium sp. MD-1 TaxID=1630648 RepID=UPI00061C57E2|nr:glycosyltransferase family 2 protein [Novosphingobium sp. MD-1]GAO56024.1 glycosyl transferase, family 2 [Novosphingobium sp. MD-1]
MPPQLTIIIPVFNEQESLGAFLDAVRTPLAQALDVIGPQASAELLFVDDGSSDRTPDMLAILAGLDARVRYLRLSRNFGKEAAIAAGLQHARGAAVVPMDVDLQDPPELLPALVREWVAGAKVVNARRVDRSSDSRLKRWTAHGFYRAVNLMAETPIPENVGDYRLLDRAAVDVINRLGESARFNKGLFAWVGFRVATVDYVRSQRHAGETKWRWRRLWSLALDGITASTTAPLRIWTYVGGVTALSAFAYAAFLVLHTLITGIDTPGYASIMISVLMLGGIQLLSIGIMGEYIGRIAKEVRQRPLYVVEQDSAAEPDHGSSEREEAWTRPPMRA